MVEKNIERKLLIEKIKQFQKDIDNILGVQLPKTPKTPATPKLRIVREEVDDKKK